MLVRDLIAALQGMPQDAEVLCHPARRYYTPSGIKPTKVFSGHDGRGLVNGVWLIAGAEDRLPGI